MPHRIPSVFIDELLARIDIVEIIGARLPLRRAGKDYHACCPFHEERTPSFTVSQSKQFYHCFGCGAHGTAVGFLMQHEQLSFPEAIADLANRAGLPLPDAASEQQQQRVAEEPLREALLRAQKLFEQQLREPVGETAVNYLRGRGLTGEIARDFGLGYAADAWNGLAVLGKDPAMREALFTAGLLIRRDGREYDRFRGRLMFPIHDHRGRLCGFGGRILDAGEPKYLNSPETPLFHKGREVYGLHAARDAIEVARQVVVVEGYMDVIALAQFGIRHAVATLGTALGAEQMERLFRASQEVVLCFDGDRAGQAAAWRALEVAMGLLRDGYQLGFVFLPEKDDPDSYVRERGPEAFREQLAKAEPLPDFFFRHLMEGVDLSRMDGRAKLAELARPLLSKLSPGVLRTMMLNQLAGHIRSPSSGIARDWHWDESPSGQLAVRPRVLSGRAERAPGMSVLKLALALLVQDPTHAQHAGDLTVLRRARQPAVQLLCDLVEHLREYPAVSTAVVLERWADRPEASMLAEMAALRHPVLGHEGTAEFMGAMARLRGQMLRRRIDALLKQQQLRPLLPDEDAELKTLLRARADKTPEASH